MNKLTSARPIDLAILLMLVAMIGAGSALAQNLTATSANELSASPQQQGDGPTDPAELETFLDDLIAQQMEEHHIAGATVAVVKDGELILAKGYGSADLENSTPVDSDQTIFSIGSLSKLVTWTAVMQLVEQGKVDLNADINTYLEEIQIPDTFPEPITLAHLMTHTTGFEELATGRFPLEIESVLPLDENIAERMPARVRPPGITLGYSNYGAALAGFIVQEVSGISYTFLQPLPPALADDLAVGYVYAQGEYRPRQEWMQGSPAGAMASTATDMSRFMIAHLQDGRYEDARILQESTAREMHRTQFSKHPKADGWTYGFMATEVNGERIIWHSGSIGVFRSAMILLPERDVGLFVSFNGAGADRRELMRTFVDHYYPGSQTAAQQPTTEPRADHKRFTGSYRGTRNNETRWEKWLALVKQASVKSASNGTLQTVGADSGVPVSLWSATGDPFVFSQIDGSDKLIFQEDKDGNIASFAVASRVAEEYFKLDWYETTMFSLLWLLVCLLIFLVNVLFWPLRYLANRLRHKDEARESVSLTVRIAQWVSWGVCAFGLFFAIAFLITSVGPHIAYGIPSATAGLLLIPLIMSVLTIVMVIFTVLAWVRRDWSLAWRAYYMLLTVTSVAFIWFMYSWNLLGWRF